MPCLFLSATGTDIGKTSVACLLIETLRHRGESVEAVKPLASGVDPAALGRSDAGRLLGALGGPLNLQNVDRINPWRFRAPLSPHLAAESEDRTIDYPAMLDWCRDRREDAGRQGSMLLIEGAGGVMSPIDNRRTMLDLMRALGVPILLLADTALGSISHTLTAWRVVAAARLDVRLCIVEAAEPAASLQQQAAILAGIGGVERPFLLRRSALDAEAKAPHAAASRLSLGQAMLQWLGESLDR